MDLNAAREFYLFRIKGVRIALNITTLGPVFRSALETREPQKIIPLLTNIAQQTELDFAGVVTKEGKTLCRIGPNSIPRGEAGPSNPIANLALQQRVTISGTVILSHQFLFAENPELANRARIKLLPTKRSIPRTVTEEISGMAMAAAVPVFEAGQFLGVLYGGVLLNQNQEIVDRVRDPTPETVSDVFKLGATQFIPKPFRPDELTQLIHQVIQKELKRTQFPTGAG